MNVSWDNIYGQSNAKKILSNILNSKRIPHALLFLGPDGVGKHFTAVRFTQLLNSVGSNNVSEAILTKINNLSEPYIKYIIPLPRGKNELPGDSPLEKLNKETLDNLKTEINCKIKNPYYKINLPYSNNIKITSIRDIRNFLSYNFDDIKYRVILIEDAHLMSDESQNALLKSLEEPPKNFIFILTTNRPELLFETINSRCWHIEFDPLSVDDVTKILTEFYQIEIKKAAIAAQFSSGSVINAIELVNHNVESLLDLTLRVLRYTMTLKIYSAVKDINDFYNNNSESLKLLIKMLIIWLGDIQKVRNGCSTYYFNNYTENIIKFNKSFPNANIEAVVLALNNILESLKNNTNLNIAILNLIFELTSLRN